MKVLLWSCALAVAAVLGIAAAMRLTEDDPDVWHVDPLTAQVSGKPNEYWVLPGNPDASREGEAAQVYPVPAPDLARAFDAVALAAPRTERIAGSPEDGWMTYVQRSRIFGFPDYVSVRVMAAGEEGATGEGSTLAILSRSRFGVSDFGVNRARVRAWLRALDGEIAAA